jgi:glycosyltransferase involved in cell wall biosynthesis
MLISKHTKSYHTVSVVVPCYNSASSLPELHERLKKTLSNLTEHYEIIYINDRSKDTTLEVLKQLAQNDESGRTCVIDLVYNVGQMRALYCGFEHADGDLVVTIDDDLQHPPEEIEKLYRYISEHRDIDVVFGKYEQKQHAFIRNLGTKFISYINGVVFNKPPHIQLSSFRIMRKEIVENILSHKTVSPVISAIILKTTTRIANVTVKHEPRKYGRSNYSFLKLVKMTFDNILNFTALPLQIISLIGISVAFISFCISLFYFLRYFFTDISVPGWTTIVVLLNFYAGLILICLGFIGEYLIRILMEVNGTPKYRIRKIYTKGNKGA